jgi:hypothetical protein
VIGLAPATDGVVAPVADAGSPRRQVRCRPGETIVDPRPGDVILIRGRGPLGLLIRVVQRIRHRPRQDRGFTRWSHAALVVTPLGHLVEVASTGVTLSKIAKYRKHDYVYVGLDLSGPQRAEAVRFAYSCLRQPYGTFDAFLLGLAVLCGDRFRVRDRGQQGCGTLIVRALQRAGMNFERGPADTLPSDLAKRFGVSADWGFEQAPCISAR